MTSYFLRSIYTTRGPLWINVGLLLSQTNTMGMNFSHNTGMIKVFSRFLMFCAPLQPLQLS